MATETPRAAILMMENELEISDEGLSQISMETGGPSAPSLTTWVLMRVVKRSNGMARRRDGSMHRLLSELMEVKVKVREGEESIDGDIEPQVWARFFFLYTQVRCP